MVCKDTTKTVTTKIDKKTNAPVKTFTAKRVCSDRADAVKEEIHPHNVEDAIEVDKKTQVSVLLPHEQLVYPEEPLKQQPTMAEVVVRDERTGEKYLKKVPLWCLDKLPDPEMVREKLKPDTNNVNGEEVIKETFERWKKFL